MVKVIRGKSFECNLSRVEALADIYQKITFIDLAEGIYEMIYCLNIGTYLSFVKKPSQSMKCHC